MRKNLVLLVLVRRSNIAMPVAKPVAVATGADSQPMTSRTELPNLAVRRKAANQTKKEMPAQRSEKVTLTNAPHNKHLRSTAASLLIVNCFRLMARAFAKCRRYLGEQSDPQTCCLAMTIGYALIYWFLSFLILRTTSLRATLAVPAANIPKTMSIGPNQ